MEAGTTERHEERLRSLREEREGDAERAEVVRDATAKAARHAVLAGIPKSKVAKLLGVSRPTLYAILDR